MLGGGIYIHIQREKAGGRKIGSGLSPLPWCSHTHTWLSPHTVKGTTIIKKEKKKNIRERKKSHQHNELMVGAMWGGGTSQRQSRFIIDGP